MQAIVPAAPVQAVVPAAPVQAIVPAAPNQLARQSLPIIVRHCGSDASCRKQQTTAMQELASKEEAVAKALRNPTTYTSAVKVPKAFKVSKLLKMT